MHGAVGKQAADAVPCHVACAKRSIQAANAHFIPGRSYADKYESTARAACMQCLTMPTSFPDNRDWACAECESKAARCGPVHTGACYLCKRRTKRVGSWCVGPLLVRCLSKARWQLKKPYVVEPRVGVALGGGRWVWTHCLGTSDGTEAACLTRTPCTAPHRPVPCRHQAVGPRVCRVPSVPRA
eukprot:364943-Chlamydomonas_euryale.AAC.33